MLMSSGFEPASELSLPYYMIKKILCFLQIIHDRSGRWFSRYFEYEEL